MPQPSTATFHDFSHQHNNHRGYTHVYLPNTFTARLSSSASSPRTTHPPAHPTATTVRSQLLSRLYTKMATSETRKAHTCLPGQTTITPLYLLAQPRSPRPQSPTHLCTRMITPTDCPQPTTITPLHPKPTTPPQDHRNQHLIASMPKHTPLSLHAQPNQFAKPNTHTTHTQTTQTTQTNKHTHTHISQLPPTTVPKHTQLLTHTETPPSTINNQQIKHSRHQPLPTQQQRQPQPQQHHKKKTPTNTKTNKHFIHQTNNPLLKQQHQHHPTAHIQNKYKTHKNKTNKTSQN